MQADNRQRSRRAKLLAAISGLLAMVAMAVTFAAVASSTANPGIQPGPHPMIMGGTAAFTTPPTVPEVQSAAPPVRAPRPTA